LALWAKTNTGWAKAPLNGTYAGGKALICGCGPSLATADIPEDRVRIVLNDGYKTVRPDIWVALDTPDFFGPDALNQPCLKVLRGGMQSTVVDGKQAGEYPATFFADIKEMPQECVFDFPHLEYQFIWKHQTMIFAVQLAWYLGFKDIRFVGVDHAPGRHTPVDPPPDPVREQLVFNQQKAFFRWWLPEASRRGLTVAGV